jgi:plastocyanin
MTPNDGRSLMAIKVGDTVTWRSSANPNAIGFSGCRVIEIGKSEDGRAAATLNLGRFGVANALVEDLSIEADVNPMTPNDGRSLMAIKVGDTVFFDVAQLRKPKRDWL